ncbi:hypothetical protein [Roseomonas populi]|uniref:LysM domain-containing protein n=1 Tax=Roseomonas populi TaxID=3121582 RepID=A0ABT1X3S9_9PROT|nr:hypothetical protein [Roseomonas pecuniae]MCR0982755.1 hypothetical protein [Roseomonas pecuniae]
MFDPASRYAALPTAVHTMPDGRAVTYALRRILPDPASLPLLARVNPAEGERLDILAARTLGDPLLYWRICDANAAMDPAALPVAGQPLAIPLPGG